jgi:hypothetical protein
MKSRMRENRTYGSVRGGDAIMQGIRILRHIKGNLETGLRRSLNKVTHPSTRLKKRINEEIRECFSRNSSTRFDNAPLNIRSHPWDLMYTPGC